jgi:hypothetical protein
MFPELFRWTNPNKPKLVSAKSVAVADPETQ